MLVKRPTKGNRYKEGFSYEGNGNIVSLKRHDQAGTVIDNLAYSYNLAVNNQLNAIQDAGGTAEGVKVGTFAYTYDKIGNLENDTEEGTSIKWTVYGKISEVTKADGKIVKYRYDGTGNRAVKMLYTNASTLFKTTYYLRDASGNVMAIYEQAATQTTTQTLIEQPIYGSSRIGIYKAPATGSVQFKLTLGYKQYELSNHLQNTLITISDNKIGVATNNANLADFYEARVLSATDYYAFGMSMKGRSWQSEKYRYGFNGQENDGDGGFQDYGMRVSKEKIGRFMSVDPITAQYPELTPYQFASNTPIEAIDLDGLENWSSKDGKQALDEKGQPVMGPIRNERQVENGIHQKMSGSAPFSFVNGLIRLKYMYQVSKLRPLYSSYEVTERHKWGVDERVRLKNWARDVSFGDRGFLDKIEPVSAKYTSTKPWYQTYHEFDMGIDPPNRPENPRFFISNKWVNRVNLGSLSLSTIGLALTAERLNDAHSEGKLGDQTAIEGGSWAGGWAGIKLGGKIMSKLPFKHPVIGLAGVAIFGIAGSIGGASAVEAMIAPKPMNTTIDPNGYEKKLQPSSDYHKPTNQ